MNITNDNIVIIFKNEDGKYSVGLSKKKKMENMKEHIFQ